MIGTAFFVALLLIPASPSAAQSTATLRGVDVYRSAALTVDEVHRRFDTRLHEYVTLRNDGRPGSSERAEALRRAMEREAAAVRGVAEADLHFSEFFTSVDHALYALFDVVDRADAPTRKAFSPAPKAVLKDPGGVLAAWRRYVARGEEVSRRGEIPVDRPNCPGFYCLWGGTPELDSAQNAFVAAAKDRAEELKRVLRADADGEARADALFVLSYAPASSEVISVCQEGLVDPDERVRGAALQVLADIANRRPEIKIPLDRVLPRLDDPASSVRGKAMGLLVPLAGRDEGRSAMLSQASRLAALLRVSEPESRDLAFTLLGILSRRTYDRRDFGAWDGWAAKAAAGKP